MPPSSCSSSTLVLQVQRSPEHCMYTLEIGPWVDIAFITICTSIVDLLQARADLCLLELAAWRVVDSPCSPCRSLVGEEELAGEDEEEDVFQFD